jgi:hypothetical protein
MSEDCDKIITIMSSFSVALFTPVQEHLNMNSCHILTVLCGYRHYKFACLFAGGQNGRNEMRLQANIKSYILEFEELM